MKKAIVLSAFGSSVPQAVSVLEKTVQAVATKFSDCLVRLSFSSQIVRNIWRKRAADMEFTTSHPDVPHYFYRIRTPLAEITDLQAQGITDIVVQPLYLVDGAEFYDLRASVAALHSIRTFRGERLFSHLRLGRPFLGCSGGDFDYRSDIREMAEVLQIDIEQAEKSDRTLVFIGHGSRHLATSVYCELEACLQKKTKRGIFFATLEGWPNKENLLQRLQIAGVQKILLKPFFYTCGTHTQNDICTLPSSFLVLLNENGFDTVVDPKPIGGRVELLQLLLARIQELCDLSDNI